MHGKKTGLGNDIRSDVAGRSEERKSSVAKQVSNVPHRRLVPRRPRRITAFLALGGLMVGGLAYGLWPRQSAAPVTSFTESETPPSAAVIEAEKAPLDRCIEQLDRAEKILAGIADMRAVFHKQERIDGVLGELNRVDLKVRVKPLSAYMHWISAPVGREILWQEDANDGLILVQAGGPLASVLPVLRIDPNGSQAMNASRHPISEIGPWHMTHELNKRVHSFVGHPKLTSTVTEVRGEGDRPVLKFSFSQPAPHGDLTCHQLVIYIDEELKVPLGYEVFDFPAAGSDMPVLDESYLYTKLELGPGLSQMDFDMTNPSYGFKKK